MPVKAVQLKLMKGEISKISSLTLSFHLGKIDRTENIYLMEIYNRKCCFFSLFGSHSDYLTQFFQLYHVGTFMSVSMLNPDRLLIFSMVLNSDKQKGCLKGEILEYF